MRVSLGAAALTVSALLISCGHSPPADRVSEDPEPRPLAADGIASAPGLLVVDAVTGATGGGGGGGGAIGGGATGLAQAYGDMSGGAGRPVPTPSGVSARRYSAEPVGDGSGGDLAITRYEAWAEVPLIDDGSRNLKMKVSAVIYNLDGAPVVMPGAVAGGGGDDDDDDDDAPAATGPFLLDEDWYGLEFTFDYLRSPEGGNPRGGSVTVAAKGNDPSGEVTVSGMLSYTKMFEDDSSWSFYLLYSDEPGYPQSYPVPGAAYTRKGSRVSATVGFPFVSMQITPNDRWSVDVSYAYRTDVSVKATYGRSERLKAYVGFEWDNDYFYRSDRPNEDDRVYFYEMRASLGLQLKLGARAYLGLSGGYAFNREIFEGADYDDRDAGVDIGDGFFGSIGLGFRF